MKLNLLSAVCLMAIITLTFSGCKKGNPFIVPGKNSCRLSSWTGLDDGYARTLHYNDKGLLDVWHEVTPAAGIDESSAYTYDRFNHVTEMDYSSQGVLYYTVNPVYKNGRIEKEIWYVPGNVVPDDTVINTYENNRLVRRESLAYDVFVHFTYDAIGNLTVMAYYGTDGTLYDSLIQTYDSPVREPMSAVPGLVYPITYLDYVISPLKYTGYKEFAPDADGNPVVVYQIDPSKSTLLAGPEDYASYYQTTDIISGTSNRQTWQFDNCNCGVDGKQQSDLSNRNSNVQKTPNAINNNVHGHIPTSWPRMKAIILEQRKAKTKIAAPALQ